MAKRPISHARAKPGFVLLSFSLFLSFQRLRWSLKGHLRDFALRVCTYLIGRELLVDDFWKQGGERGEEISP